MPTLTVRVIASADLVETDGTVLAPGDRAGFGHQRRLDRVVHRARRGNLAGDDVEEGGELCAERASEAIHEEVPRLTVREVDTLFGGAQRQPVVEPGRDGALRPEELEPDVVPTPVGATVGDHGDGALGQPEH